MIQFNLLPDVKQQYIKAVYRRRVITFVCFLISGVFVIVFVLMFLFVRVNQTGHLKRLDENISTTVAELKENPDLDKILTIQNQLKSLPKLHDDKIISSRIFEYLAQLTPSQASVFSVEADLETKTISIKGGADSITTLNKFVDTIKFTDFKLEGDTPKEGKAFSSVVLESFSFENQKSTTDASTSVNYEIKFVYEETIFMNTAKEGSAVANGVKLTVPKIITTRSETQKPSALFQPNTSNENASEGNN